MTLENTRTFLESIQILKVSQFSNRLPVNMEAMACILIIEVRRAI